MPEEAEIDTDRLRETIDEELERSGHRLLRWISLTTALLAALAAIASLQAGDTVNEALVLKAEATRLQAEASDQWAYYQAKGIKGAIARAAGASYRASGKAPPADGDAEAARYAREQAGIQRQAMELERKRDDRSREADGLLERHRRFASAVALLSRSWTQSTPPCRARVTA